MDFLLALMTLVHVCPQLIHGSKLPIANGTGVLFGFLHVALDVSHQGRLPAKHHSTFGTFERLRWTIVGCPVLILATAAFLLATVDTAYVASQQAGTAE